MKTVTMKVKELYKEGVSNGKPWSKYQYYGDDGEHYILFDNLELEKPYQLEQVDTVSKKDGKKYTNWVVAKEAKAGGGGVRLIMEKLELMSAEISDIKRAVEQIVGKPRLPVKDINEADLPF